MPPHYGEEVASPGPVGRGPVLRRALCLNQDLQEQVDGEDISTGKVTLARIKVGITESC